MAFGFKMKGFQTKTAYTIEELYEAIKDKTFTAGEPSLTKSGLNNIITFPPLDRNNQIWVYPSGFKKPPYTKWTVQKGQLAGVGNAVLNNFMSDLTGGGTAASGVFGKNAKKIEELVEITTQELDALGL